MSVRFRKNLNLMQLGVKIKEIWNTTGQNCPETVLQSARSRIITVRVWTRAVVTKPLPSDLPSWLALQEWSDAAEHHVTTRWRHFRQRDGEKRLDSRIILIVYELLFF